MLWLMSYSDPRVCKVFHRMYSSGSPRFARQNGQRWHFMLCLVKYKVAKVCDYFITALLLFQTNLTHAHTAHGVCSDYIFRILLQIVLEVLPVFFL